MLKDEVVLCLFEGSAPAVQLAAQEAGIPFERILESTHSPWSRPTSETVNLDPGLPRGKE